MRSNGLLATVRVQLCSLPACVHASKRLSVSARQYYVLRSFISSFRMCPQDYYVPGIGLCVQIEMTKQARWVSIEQAKSETEFMGSEEMNAKTSLVKLE